MPTLIENAVKVNNEDLHGIVRLVSFDKAPKKGGGVFGTGQLTVKGGETLGFKIWDDIVIKRMDEVVADLGLGCYLMVGCKGNIYNGGFSVILEQITVVDQSSLSIRDFARVNHDVGSLMKRVNTILANRVSEKGRSLVSEILTGDLAKRFVEEFAGKSMHDAEPIGLLHHTTKMLEITDLVMQQQGNFSQESDNIDLIYIGVLLHDIGKTLELKDGVYTDISIATHRFLGAEVLFSYKESIVSKYSELWYYNLVSILTQHHGKYEEKPRTVFSYIIHLVDNFDTQLTIMKEKVDSTESGQTWWFDEMSLRIEK